jgi:hypothetical protein
MIILPQVGQDEMGGDDDAGIGVRVMYCISSFPICSYFPLHGAAEALAAAKYAGWGRGLGKKPTTPLSHRKAEPPNRRRGDCSLRGLGLDSTVTGKGGERGERGEPKRYRLQGCAAGCQPDCVSRVHAIHASLAVPGVYHVVECSAVWCGAV